MLDLQDPLIQIKITSALCSAVAVATTIYRLIMRRGRLWVDDAWASFSMVALFIQVAAVFMHVPNPMHLSHVNRVASYYLMATTFYAVIWSARLSIIFSIIRIDPSEARRRRLLYAAILFLVVCIVLISQLYWVCEPQPGWKDLPSPQCTLNKEIAISQLVSDVIADLILILSPLKLLQGLEDKGLRYRLMLIFSSCIVTTVVSLVHAVYILKLGGTKVVVAALVEDCFSLIVCNIPVVVTSTIRLRDRSRFQSTSISTILRFSSHIQTHTVLRIEDETAIVSNESRSRGEATFPKSKATCDESGIDDICAMNLQGTGAISLQRCEACFTV